MRLLVKQLLMVSCQSTINRAIVSALFHLQKVKLGDLCALENSHWLFFFSRFQVIVIVGRSDPQTTALNGNKQQDGTKVDSVLTPPRTDGVLARKPLPLAALPMRRGKQSKLFQMLR